MAIQHWALGALIALGTFAAGCQSYGSGKKDVESAAASSPPSALHCEKCKVAWMKVPVTTGSGKAGQVTSYRTTKSMECPDCRSMAQNFFSSGKLEHTCSSCGPNAMEVCKTH